MNIEIEEQQPKQIEYVRPLGQISRFECPASSDQHSKYLNSYEMYKYHIKFCRELRNLSEVFICKFCVKLFLESNKRDQHQVKCSCRLVQDNSVFEMPNHLKNTYQQNKITFDNQDEFYEIINAFPPQEPLSIHFIEGSGIKSDFADEDFEDDTNQLRVEKNCCEKDSNQLLSEDILDSEDEVSSQDLKGLQQSHSYEMEVESSENLSIIKQQIDILSVQEQLLLFPDQSNNDQSLDLKPSRKKYSAKRFINIIKKKENRHIQQANNIPEHQKLEKGYQSTKEINVLSQQDQDQMANQGSLSVSVKSNNKMIDEDVTILENTQYSASQNQIQAFRQQNKKRNDYPQLQKDLKIVKQIKLYQEKENTQVQSQSNENSFNDATLQQNIFLQDHLKQDTKENQSKRLINIKIIDFLNVHNVILQEEENFINSNHYLKYLAKKNFQKYNSYYLKNISNQLSYQHLIASFTVQENIEYLQQNFIRNPKDSQFCLIQIEFNKLQDFFTQEQPYVCYFNDNNNININDNSYKSKYSIFILTLDNSQILEKDFAPQLAATSLDGTDDIMKPFQKQEIQQQQKQQQSLNQNKQSNFLKPQNQQNLKEQQNDFSATIKLNLYVYEGFQAWNYDLKLNQVYLVDRLSQELLETAAIDLKIWDRYRSQTEKQYSHDIEIYSKMKEEKSQQLLEIKDKIESEKRATLTKKKIRLGKEKQMEEQIQKKISEKENNLLKYNQMQKEIIDLKNQVNQLQQNLTQEIEKEFKSAKDKSDQIYNQQVEKHISEINSLLSENITDQLRIIEHLKQENQNQVKEQYNLMDIQRKQGQLLLKYDQKLESLQNIKRNKEKLIQLQKGKQSTAYMCLICKKYPQSCLQKPCGHVVCCYTCLNAENDEKEIIFCKICNIEIIKFSEIKYKVLH